MAGPTVRDVAREAGVSLATVDRVLNARGGVTESTIQRVNEAIRAIGYVRDLTAANLARKRRYHFAFVLPHGSDEFVQLLRRAVEEAVSTQVVDRTELTVVSVGPNDQQQLVATLRELREAAVDGVAIYASETPRLRDEIAHFKEQGLAVVALVSDLPHSGRDFFVGFDNVAAGRTAGALMGRFLGSTPGPVAVLASSMQASSDAQRRLGFDEVMRTKFPNVKVLPSLEGHGQGSVVRRGLDNIFAREPDIVGVYSVGDGTSSLIDYLDERGPGCGPVVIAHELTGATRAALLRGTVDAVIRQDVGHVARSALRVLRAVTDGVDILHAQERIRVEIIVPENIP